LIGPQFAAIASTDFFCFIIGRLFEEKRIIVFLTNKTKMTYATYIHSHSDERAKDISVSQINVDD